MTKKAIVWFIVFSTIAVTYLALNQKNHELFWFVSTIGALFGGALVAFIYRLFWRKYTYYELWFSSASMWLALLVLTDFGGAT